MTSINTISYQTEERATLIDRRPCRRPVEAMEANRVRLPLVELWLMADDMAGWQGYVQFGGKPMSGQAYDWPTCDQDECIGIRLDAGRRCLAHASEQERTDEFSKLFQTGKIDARGVMISAELLKAIVSKAPRDPDAHPMFAQAWFSWATFHNDDAMFDEV